MPKNISKYIYTFLGPFLAILIWTLTDLDKSNPNVSLMAGIAVWMSTWWFTEAVHIAVTALVPFLMMPILGISDTKSVAQQYTDSIIFLFIGGFMLAFAIEKWQLHKRIAIKILSLVGTKPANILLGVMLSAYLISNWISNTATTMMLFGAVLALIHETDEFIHGEKSKNRFAAAVLLGLAFSATIGGMATPVGTPPNMYFFKAYKEAFPTLNDLNFLKWATIGFPLSALFLVCTFFVLRYYYLKKSVVINDIEAHHFKKQYKNLGSFSYEEKWIGFIFITCMVLWFTRADIPFETFTFKGWNHLFSKSNLVDDATVAIAAALLLFLIPSKQKPNEAILEWEDARKIRYDIILMFGSGFALAHGFDVSGLSDWLANTLAALKGVPVFFIILGICTIVTIISEFASNIASIQLAIPVMIALQKDLELPPLLLMIPATFAASLGFMLPVATAANTIVFGTKRIDIKDMFRVGIVLDIIGITIITVFCYLYLS